MYLQCQLLQTADLLKDAVDALHLPHTNPTNNPYGQN